MSDALIALKLLVDKLIICELVALRLLEDRFSALVFKRKVVMSDTLMALKFVTDTFPMLALIKDTFVALRLFTDKFSALL